MSQTKSAGVMDRRTFLTLTAAATAAAAVSARAAGAPAAAPGASAVKAPAQWRNTVIVNALGQLLNPNENLPGVDPNSYRAGRQRVLDDARAAGLTAVNVTLSNSADGEGAFESTLREIEGWDATVGQYPHDLLKVLTAADILKAKADNKIGVIYGFQNAAMVGTRAERIDEFKARGVRVIQLTYNPANQIGDGCMVAENRGLTPFGHEVVARLNANRIMVDLSHSGERTCLEATRASSRPVSINHTGCRALTNLPRNKTDEELRLVASRGGFVGIYFMPYLNVSGHPNTDDVIAHIEHAINVCGEDHVGIGTDGGTTPVDDLETFKTALAKEVEARQAAGISATGERADTYPFVVDLRGTDQFYLVAERLRKRGIKSSVVEKVLGRNFIQCAREVWGNQTPA